MKVEFCRDVFIIHYCMKLTKKKKKQHYTGYKNVNFYGPHHKQKPNWEPNYTLIGLLGQNRPIKLIHFLWEKYIAHTSFSLSFVLRFLRSLPEEEEEDEREEEGTPKPSNQTLAKTP